MRPRVRLPGDELDDQLIHAAKNAVAITDDNAKAAAMTAVTLMASRYNRRINWEKLEVEYL